MKKINKKIISLMIINLEIYSKKKLWSNFLMRSFSRLEYVIILFQEKIRKQKLSIFLRNNFKRLLSKLSESMKDFFWIDGLQSLFDRTYNLFTVTFYDDFGYIFLQIYKHIWNVQEMLKLLLNIKKEKFITRMKGTRLRGRWLTPMLETCLLKKNVRVSCNLFVEFTKELSSALDFDHYLTCFQIFESKKHLFQFVFYKLLSNEFLINRKLWSFLKSFFKKKGFRITKELIPTRYGLFSTREDLCLEPFFILVRDLLKLKKKFSKKKDKKFRCFERHLVSEQAEIWIDGANVGHFAQKQPNYSLSQVNKIYTYFCKWKKIKIVLSESRIKKIPVLKIDHLIQNWKNKKDLYICPCSIDDDQWWLFGSLISLKNYQYLSIITNDLLRNFSFSGREFITSSWLQTHVLRIFINHTRCFLKNRKIEMEEFLSDKKRYILKPIVNMSNWKTQKNYVNKV